LHFKNVETVTRGLEAIDLQIDVTPAGDALGDHRCRAGYLLHAALDRLAQFFQCGEIGAGDLDADRALDAGGQHVDAVADRLHPDIGHARNLEARIQLLDELLWCHAGPPLFARLELNRGLQHFQRRGVGRGLCAARLAEYRFHFGHGFDQAVGELQYLRCLGR